MTLSNATSKTPALELVCQKIQQETRDVKTFFFAKPQSKNTLVFHYHAGQHINFTVNIAGKIQHCCYTLSSSPTNADYISITIKRIPQGKVSNFFYDAFTVGQTIVVQQVNGDFYIQEPVADQVLLISAGSGITPILSMLRFMVAKKCKNEIIFIHSAKRKTDIIAQTDITNLAKLHGNCHVIYTLTDTKNSQWHGFQGRLDKDILSNITQLHNYQSYVCGPKGFRETVQALLIHLGLPASHYHEESFGNHNYSNVIQDNTATESQPELPVTTTPLVSEQNRNAKVVINFTRWHKRYQGNKQATLLEQGEKAGLILPYSCRAGSCGRCKAKLISGNVKQDQTEGLSASEQRQGYILLCSCTALTDIEISHE